MAGRLLDQWAYLIKVELNFSRPEKLNNNAFIEAFNSRLRRECLNAAWFLSMATRWAASKNGGTITTKTDPAFSPRRLDASRVR